MAKLKKNLREYARIPNSLINNKEVSFKAKGLFAYIESKPDGWEFAINRIAYDTKDGKDSIRVGLLELEQAGYLKRQKYQNESGYWKTLYILTDIPFDYVSENPTSENPTQENPTLENPINNKERSNKERNKKERSDTQLLNLLNEKTERNFKLLPRGYKNTLDKFTLNEISQALDNLKKDKWHKERLHELSKEYLLRATTIDNFLSVGTSEEEKRTKNNIEQLKKLRYADE